MIGLFVDVDPASERYLSHGWMGREVPLPIRRYPLYSPQHPSTPSHYLAMAYFNDNDGFYPAPTAPDEFGLYPFLQYQISATPEEVPCQAVPTFANDWTTVNQPGSSANLATTHGEKSSSLFNNFHLTRGSLRTTFPRTWFIS